MIPVQEERGFGGFLPLGAQGWIFSCSAAPGVAWKTEKAFFQADPEGFSVQKDHWELTLCQGPGVPKDMLHFSCLPLRGEQNLGLPLAPITKVLWSSGRAEQEWKMVRDGAFSLWFNPGATAGLSCAGSCKEKRFFSPMGVACPRDFFLGLSPLKPHRIWPRLFLQQHSVDFPLFYYCGCIPRTVLPYPAPNWIIKSKQNHEMVWKWL